MPLAYLILAHGQPEHVARLARRLSHPDDLVLVHVDRKAELAPFEAAFAAAGVAPLLVRPRVAVHWGGWGIVQAQLAGMRAAVRSGRPFSHLVLLSGADYPIRSTEEIRAFFAAHPGQSFLSWSEGDREPYTDADRRGNAVWRWSGDLERLTTWCISVRGRRWQLTDPTDLRARLLPRRRIPAGLTPAQGSGWWNLSAEAVVLLLATLRRRPALGAYFRFVFAADENLFQMLLLASPLRDRLVNEDLRFMHWDGNSPPVITADDVPEMRASLKLFARKFDAGESDAARDALDRLSADPVPRPR